MATTTRVTEARVLKRRIIERPRLFALLDESRARIRTLIAPAGYGKTTLAEQWVRRSGRRAAWYTARSASTDVAALAVGLAKSAAAFVDGCELRLREHLRALPAPADNVETLAEILGEDLAAWPRDAWLVIDDYHEVAQEPSAERFVSELVSASPIQLLIASRQRPAWVTPRRILYGEVLEIDQPVLAMNDDEASEVLVGRSAPSTAGLVALAKGWPAVIGLASVSEVEIGTDVDRVPESLYRFFAEEVFSSLGEAVQDALTTLSVAPLLDRELITRVLGEELAELVCAAALDVGILVERGVQLELHPLARAYLTERSGQTGMPHAGTTIDACLDHYWKRREWDAAFDVIARTSSLDRLEDLVGAALDELLETARLSTLERWCDLASTACHESSLFSIARAELMLRHGRHIEAMVHAEAAAASGTDLAFRALSIAGRAAHLASREEHALDLYRRAESAGRTESERRDAGWGQLMCLVELERPEATELLRALDDGVALGDAKQVVRSATCRLSFQTKLGNLELADAELAIALVHAVNDPLLVSSFQSALSGVFGMAARYPEALIVANEFLETIERYRLDFARPYALCSASQATAGLRRWAEAEAYARDALAMAGDRRDGHAEQLSFSHLMRVLAQQGRHLDALRIPTPVVRDSLPAAHADVVSSRALVLAALGRVDEARRAVSEVRGLSKAVEPAVLIASVDAICALAAQDTDAIERAIELEETAFERGGVDFLVTAYRAAPELLNLLLRASDRRARLIELIVMATDEDLADALGQPVGVDADPTHRLTPREWEVYTLLAEGRTNKEIARLLVIEVSTVKVHAQHIYDKLGIRSRRALAVRAALERGSQATSATTSSNEPRAGA